MADAKLTPAQYQAYENLYNALNDATMKDADDGTLTVLNNAAQTLSDILTGDNELNLDANTALFAAFAKDMDGGNKALNEIKAEVASIDARIGTAGKLIEALSKVISVIPAV